MHLYRLNNSIVQVKIQSRHTSSKKHKLWIKYDSLEGTIIGWYCLCKADARTLGCCAHVASVIWFLGYYRHCERKQRRCHNYKNFVLVAQSQDDEPDIDQDWQNNNDSSSEDESDEED